MNDISYVINGRKRIFGLWNLRLLKYLEVHWRNICLNQIYALTPTAMSLDLNT